MSEIKSSGWNRPAQNDAAKVAGRSRPSPIRGIVAGAVVVVLAGLVAWLMLKPSGDESTKKATRARIADKGGIKQAAPVAKAQTSSSNAVETVETAQEEVKKPRDPKEVVKVLQAWTNSTGVIEDVVVRADGSRVRRVYDPRPVTFLNPCDQAIVTTLSFRPGQEIPPTPMDADLEKAFEESLKTPIEIKEDDDPQIKAQKLLVIEMRKEIAEMRKDGRKVADILNEHIKINNENAQIRNDAMRELRDIVKSGDAEGARKYMLTMNAAFSQMGIPEIDMPKSAAERHAELEAAAANAQGASN